MKKVLIVAAQPDDKILGLRGTIARLINAGLKAYTLILGEETTSRDNKREISKRKNEMQQLKNNMFKANKIIGISKVFTINFSDNRFDSVSLLDIVKKIEKIKNKIKPDTIFTHYRNDLNIDYRKTFEAVLTAARPMEDETVKTIYSFEILSSTEWNYPTTLSPNVFFDISNYLDKKIDSMNCYKAELRDFPHPRSVETISNNAKNWGSKVGLKYAEEFKLIRKIN